MIQHLKLAQIVISDEVRHHDVDVTIFGYEIGQMAEMPAAYKSDEKLMEIAKQAVTEVGEHQYGVGLICSGDVFMNDPVRVEKVREHFPTNESSRNGSGSSCTSLSPIQYAICCHSCIIRYCRERIKY